MANLTVTIIDVGHGDCIFVEAENGGSKEFALIDCPDSVNLCPGLLYVKRRIEQIYGKKPAWPSPQLLSFVLMTHAHRDHCQGLHRIMKEFGTKWFVYGRAAVSTPSAHVLAYAKRARVKVGAMTPVDSTTPFPVATIGAATISVLYPDSSPAVANENDNSVVLAFEQSGVAIVLTGDVETGCWSSITLPANTKVFKAPHHGADSGTISGGVGVWPPLLSSAEIGVSCHRVPHSHPDAAAIAAMTSAGHHVYQTDLHQDIVFSLDGSSISVKYHH